MSRTTLGLSTPLALVALLLGDTAFAQVIAAGDGISHRHARVARAATSPTHSGRLTQAGLRLAADEAARARPSSSQAANAPPRNSCFNRLVLGGAIGAGAGLGFGYAWLVKAGGSDSAGAVLRFTTGAGLLLGLLGGAIACSP